MGALDYALIALYAAGMIAVGAVVSTRIGNFRDFFLAGGRMTTPILVCTLVSTYYGLDVLFGGSELSYKEGVIAWFAYTRPYYIAILIAAVFIARKLKRFDFVSLPEVLGHFYGNGTRVIAAIASAFYALPLLSIMGIGVLLDVVTPLPFSAGVLLGAGVALIYTLLGGLLADALTDTLQFTLMCITLGIAAALVMRQVGGFEGMANSLPVSYMQAGGRYPPWVILVYATSALSALVEPAFYQRIFAAVSYRAVLIALCLGIGLWAAYDWITTVLGMAAAATGLQTDPRYALLTIAMDVLPVGLKGLFVAGVLAAAMSTIDSYLLIAGGSIAYDIYRPVFNPGISDRAELALTRWMTVVACAASIILALFFDSMVSAWIFMSTVLIAAVLVPLVVGLYARRAPVPAAGLAASVTGLLVAVGYFVLTQVSGSYDVEWETVIWHLPLGERTIPLWQDYAVLFALPASALAYVLASIAGKRMTRT